MVKKRVDHAFCSVESNTGLPFDPLRRYRQCRWNGCGSNDHQRQTDAARGQSQPSADRRRYHGPSEHTAGAAPCHDRRSDPGALPNQIGRLGRERQPGYQLRNRREWKFPNRAAARQIHLASADLRTLSQSLAADRRRPSQVIRAGPDRLRQRDSVTIHQTADGPAYWQLENLTGTIDVLQLNLPVCETNWVENQKVQSSVGSTLMLA